MLHLNHIKFAPLQQVAYIQNEAKSTKKTNLEKNQHFCCKLFISLEKAVTPDKQILHLRRYEIYIDSFRDCYKQIIENF